MTGRLQLDVICSVHHGWKTLIVVSQGLCALAIFNTIGQPGERTGAAEVTSLWHSRAWLLWTGCPPDTFVC